MKTKIGTESMFEAHDEKAKKSASALSVLGKAAELLTAKDAARAEEHPRDREFTYKPTLPRDWVRAPVSVLSTAASRRDWFRVMQFNMMVDDVTDFSPYSSSSSSASSSSASAPHRTTPVLKLDYRIPSFTRPSATDAAAANGSSPWVTYDPTIDTQVPPFLDFSFRRKYLVNEVRYYDPDLICLNEVNRIHFNGDLWRYLRSQGYGSLYSSSRGYQVRCLRSKENPNVRGNESKIPEYDDIGNAIFFHKARFVPQLMGGAELPNHLHFAQFCALKDKVSNMTVVVANVQFTLGDTEEAMCIRKHEAEMTMKVIRAICKEGVDRAHSTVMVVGDFNCSHEEEPCVEVVRKQLFSSYDLVGGPRWTTWCHGKEGVKPNSYYEHNKRGWEESDVSRAKLLSQIDEVRRREQDRILARSARSGASLSSAATFGGDNVGGSAAAAKKIVKRFEERIVDEKYPWLSETRVVEREVELTPEEATHVAQKDDIAIQRDLQLSQGIIKRTQDFIFYDPHTVALHQVLDTPDEGLIDETQMLPCTKHPSHHVPLMVDISFNDVMPDVGAISTRK
eukprot:CAMPEP_0176440906 /NCGR_PEP_ID=MMETSP0127-20121128/20866_1 /TAXON_ID=938130 /ORGANISM="Platyophrya macrostoma, Strain WH" /LENGTH=564 /DNA_ID=CAMNT_0017825553 /DNA_START=121 /DNA_END=1815 /DNA_ORIENTATION=-